MICNMKFKSDQMIICGVIIPFSASPGWGGGEWKGTRRVLRGRRGADSVLFLDQGSGYTGL